MQRKWKRRWQRLTKAILPPVAAGLLFLSAYSPALANPAGGTVVSGSASISNSGATMTVNQTTNKAIINWQSFSIGSGETVNFVQPGSTAVALNRVIGSDASSIYGSLNANGKVYLVNPNGILFAPGSSVNVGGLVASTLNISDSDFLNGKYTWQTDGSAGSVVNQGTLTATNEAVLIGPQVANEGVIAAKVTGLAAGNSVSLDFSGDSLLNVTVDTGALNGSANNNGTITATGGLVVMSAGTKDALLNTVVNNSGVIRAQSVNNVNGVIRLEGNSVATSGTLDASGKTAGQTGGTVKLLGDTVTVQTGATIDVAGDAGGGTALIGGAYQGGSSEYAATNTTVQTGATINADAVTSGNGGQVVVWANDTTNFAGTITAKGGSVSGNGGSVEVSGKQTLNLGKTTIVNTTAAHGTTGKLLLDPAELTVDAANVSTYTGLLANNNTTISTSTGDLAITTPVSWDAATTLTLDSAAGISISEPITATNGGLTVTANGTVTSTAAVNVKTFTLTKGIWSQIAGSLSDFSATDFRISGGTFIRATGGDGSSASPYQIADIYGLQGIGSAGMLGSYYTLAINIDASGTKYWNYDSSTGSYLGFVPIGTIGSQFTGSFDGAGHTISGLTINRSGTSGVGLFGASSGTISSVGLVGGSVVGANNVGGLVGNNYSSGSITNSYSTGTVTGGDNSNSIGGLVGSNAGSIESSYSTGTVTGGDSSYYIGGLVGYNYGGKITNCYWDVDTSGQTAGIGAGTTSGSTITVTGLYSKSASLAADSSRKSAFAQDSYSGFDFDNTWYMVDGQTRPFLRSEYSTTVTNAHQLQLMALDLAATYTLANDIKMSELTNDSGLWRTKNTQDSNSSYGFVPIGNPSRSAFIGRFDGAGYTISGLIINRPSADYVGLFGYSSGSISSVGLINGSVTGAYYTGGLVGNSYSAGRITDCYSTDTVTGSSSVGGLVGLNNGSINKSYSTGAVTGSGDAVGGLVGSNAGSIESSHSTGAVTGGDGSYSIGGLVGYNDSSGSIESSYSTGAVTGGDGSCYLGGLVGSNDGSIASSYSTGAVTGGDNSYIIGGLVGYNYGSSSSIASSHSTGAVTGGDGSYYLGGLVGSNDGSIASSYSTGAVTGGSNSNSIGGLVGFNGGSSGSITNSYSTGAVSGSNDVGGLVGFSYSSGSITNSYSTGAVSGGSNVGGLVGDNVGSIETSYSTGAVSGISNVGGLVGYNDSGTITASYYATTDATGAAINSGSGYSGYGTGKTLAELTDPATFSGWDIAATGGSSAVWRIYSGYTTPLLRSFLTPVTVTAAPAGKTYDGTAAAGSNLAYTLSDPGASLSAGAGGLSYTTGSKNAGDYSTADGTLTFSGLYSGQQGYDISYTATALTINKAALTITAAAGTKTYDGTTAAGAAPTVTAGSLQGGDTFTSLTEMYTDKNAGTGKTLKAAAVINDGNNGNNYAVTYADNTSGVIHKANLTVTANDITKTYDGTTTVTGGSAAATGNTKLYGNDTISGGSYAFADKNAGSNKTVTVSNVTVNDGNGGNNYAVSYAANTGSIINKAALTMTANDVTKTYDGTTTVTGGSAAVTGNTKLYGNDTISGGSYAFADKNAGSSKTVTVSNVMVEDGNNGNNYAVSYAANTGSVINKAALTVTAAAGTKTYDGTTTSAGAAPTVTAGSLQGGDTFTSLTEMYTDKNAGTGKTLKAAAVINDGNNGNNYAVTYADNTNGVIHKANLTVTANDVTKTTGQPNPSFTAGYSGLGAGDTPAALAGSLTFDTAATAASGPGTYAITLTGTLTSPNYTVSYANGSLTVTGRPVDPAYDGAVIQAGHLADGLLGPFGRYGQPHGLSETSGYQAGAAGSAAPLTIVGTGINTGGYLLLSDTTEP